jgi:hypothetical protein
MQSGQTCRYRGRFGAEYFNRDVAGVVTVQAITDFVAGLAVACSPAGSSVLSARKSEAIEVDVFASWLVREAVWSMFGLAGPA